VAVEAHGATACVRTATGEHCHARHAIVCSGADLRTLFPEQLAKAGLARCKLLMLRTVPLPAVHLGATLASGLTLRRYASFRMCPSWPRLEAESVELEVLKRGIHILIVQEADGSLVIGDSHEYAPGDLDEILDVRTEQLILAEAGRLARGVNGPIAARWH